MNIGDTFDITYTIDRGSKVVPDRFLCLGPIGEQHYFSMEWIEANGKNKNIAVHPGQIWVYEGVPSSEHEIMCVTETSVFYESVKTRQGGNRPRYTFGTAFKYSHQANKD